MGSTVTSRPPAVFTGDSGGDTWSPVASYRRRRLNAALSLFSCKNCSSASVTASRSPIMPAWHASGRCTKLARGAAKCISFTTTPFTLKSFPPVTINVGTSRRSNRSNTSIAVCL